MNYYVIAFKGWAEIRKAKRAPIRHVTTAVRNGEVQVYDSTVGYWDYARGPRPTKKVPVKTVLKSIYHEGGEVVGTVKKDMLRGILDATPRVGTCKKLTQLQVRHVSVLLNKQLL